MVLRFHANSGVALAQPMQVGGMKEGRYQKAIAFRLGVLPNREARWGSWSRPTAKEEKAVG